MKVFSSVISGIALASLGAASPQATITPQVTIYGEPNYQGAGQTFPADGTCHSLFPWIESVLIPPGEFVYCQLFNKANCEGQGDDVIVASHPAFTAEQIYPGIICGVLS
ncbi:hypothetical protein ASPCAL12384 [Aspergillus calidoustus]|uniref:Uncharacterized protein n=1 Tax=Aspergillus calidoustus TaxID=454130 RepID=A0A0U5GDW1_ASPCI|nr:hypothetical protein ASPCAL12384 [Aspergillus calidoustus]